VIKKLNKKIIFQFPAIFIALLQSLTTTTAANAPQHAMLLASEYI
jgi:hypothetical protein